MRLNGEWIRSVSLTSSANAIRILDQTRLPYELHFLELSTRDDIAHAIRTMQVRGAPLIGAVAAFGLAFALVKDGSDANLTESFHILSDTRPTAVNLAWALQRIRRKVLPFKPHERGEAALIEAKAIADEDVAMNKAIGSHGLAVFKEILKRKSGGGPLNILTHCNPGWFATVDYGTATAPMYLAYDEGLPIHVYVDETRPRNQGAITAFELAGHGVPHTVIVDNAGGHLMRLGQIDLVIVGTDRVTANGDVCNKIGTYLKALAARDNGVPFYVALPSSTLDLNVASGDDIPIEERAAHEVSHMQGVDETGRKGTLRLYPEGSNIANPAFDVTPARLITGLITEHGVIAPNKADLRRYAAQALSHKD
jgi:methylthioribose-1-phosphate isomerase